MVVKEMTKAKVGVGLASHPSKIAPKTRGKLLLSLLTVPHPLIAADSPLVFSYQFRGLRCLRSALWVIAVAIPNQRVIDIVSMTSRKSLPGLLK